ncbi:hypothetical protein AMTR_s00069p00157720 [Amborella trichopoda]|uniref:Uncharacterized protein n=1 Tax=Amborella trichopoda TaxID=13333 RepID=U5DA70_AMBTC|nr:hypothetical protein AMTR_s00069p00157720 [Amborella trichopoda]
MVSSVTKLGEHANAFIFKKHPCPTSTTSPHNKPLLATVQQGAKLPLSLSTFCHSSPLTFLPLQIVDHSRSSPSTKRMTYLKALKTIAVLCLFPHRIKH